LIDHIHRALKAAKNDRAKNRGTPAAFVIILLASDDSPSVVGVAFDPPSVFSSVQFSSVIQIKNFNIKTLK